MERSVILGSLLVKLRVVIDGVKQIMLYEEGRKIEEEIYMSEDKACLRSGFHGNMMSNEDMRNSYCN